MTKGKLASVFIVDDSDIERSMLTDHLSKYKSLNVRTLYGSVPDADDMYKYLRESLGVPADQITNLRDSEATRAIIINGFRAIRDDSRIRNGDAIVIFYAGHGNDTKAPDGWESEGDKTQYITPHDIRTTGDDGKEIFGIPDRTIAALINDIAKAKGDNIVRYKLDMIIF